MTLLGNAAVVMWIDLPEAARAEHDAWHSGEHFPERLAIPGFLRARRAVADASDGAPAYFVMYELEQIGVTTSAPYLERLNNPTPWSRKIMAQVSSMNRTLCHVRATHGRGTASTFLTLRAGSDPARLPALRAHITGVLMPALKGNAAVSALHLLERARNMERPDTLERQLRSRPDNQTDLALVAEGHDLHAIRLLAMALRQDAMLAKLCTWNDLGIDVYRLACLMTPDAD
ncbi:hypothetical protein [Cupriavidus basilensis]|uniref:hypothetical protein n=1 Tax=Cupriavidus basilensis TaxID=68895 RepID=UPI00283FF91F|nr:hypothetical protein [Cupriavidus basilensis]MDR3384981.1 hypothetical protein [Cupriavidus basilensis]